MKAPAAADFAAAFEAAVALPSAGPARAIKAEVEADSLAGLIEADHLPEAVAMGPTADAARGTILDRLIGAQLASGDAQGAWKTWSMRPTHEAEAFPFRGAAALMASDTHDPRARGILNEAVAAISGINGPRQAALAMDFLETTAGESHTTASTVAEATRTLAARLPVLLSPGWEQTALWQRCAAVLKGLGAGPALAPLPAPKPELKQRQPVALDPAQRFPAADLAPFNQTQAILMRRRYLAAQRGGKPPSADLIAAAPSYAARAAYDLYCKKKTSTAEALLEQALASADAKAAQPRPPQAINYDGELFWVYGLAAQMDFPLAVKHAQALPAGGWFRPLALAHVARFAAASAANHPGHCFQVLH